MQGYDPSPAGDYFRKLWGGMNGREAKHGYYEALTISWNLNCDQDAIADMIPPKKHLLRHQPVNAQIGLMDGNTFCTTLEPRHDGYLAISGKFLMVLNRNFIFFFSQNNSNIISIRKLSYLYNGFLYVNCEVAFFFRIAFLLFRGPVGGTLTPLLNLI